MTFDEVLQEPSEEDRLRSILRDLVWTIDECETCEELRSTPEYLDAKRAGEL